MTNGKDDDDTIERLIKFFKSGDSTKRINKKLLNESTKIFRQRAQHIGLSSIQIFEVSELVATNKYDELNSNQLVHALLPRESVSEETVLMIVSKMCADVQSLKVKSLLLRWMILIFDVIASKSKFHNLYGMLFHFIQNDTLCPYVFHLLFLLTRKEDVTHYRVVRLLELQRKVGSQPHLSGLLSAYRMYHPALVSMSGTYKRFFKGDKVWEQSIIHVQQTYGLNLLNEFITQNASSLKFNLKSDKITESPKPTMVHDRSICYQSVSGFVTGRIPVHHIKSFQELLKNISQLEISSQAFTLLSSKTLQHVMSITSDRTIAIRLSMWLHHTLTKELISTIGETDRGKELLNLTIKFSSLIQECLPVCEEFLFRYLWTWNGRDYQKYLFSMICKLRLMPYQELHNKILVPLLKNYVFSTHVYFKCSVIKTLSELLNNYLTIERARVLETQQNQENSATARYAGFMQETWKEFDYGSTILQLVCFVDQLFVQSVRTVKKDETLLLHYILQFHLQVSNIYLVHGEPHVILPSTQVLFHSLFSLSAPCLVMLLKILNNHVRTVVALRKKTTSPGLEKIIELLNRYCVDVFDALWRRRAFHPSCQKETDLFLDLHEELFEPYLTHPLDLPTRRMFSVDRHPALIVYTKQYLSVFGKPFEASNNAEFLLEDSFREFLEANGLKDIVEFVQLLQAT